MKKETKIYVARTSSDVEIPEYKSHLAAGMDVKSVGRYVIFPQQKIVVNTGLVLAIDSLASLDVRPRSGLSLNTPLEIPNSPGTIDADYRDEIGIIIKNTSLPKYEDWKNNNYTKVWNYFEERGKVNGKLTEEDIDFLKKEFDNVYTLNDKGNLPGIYVINPGDRIAQILMGDQTRIKWGTEDFLTEEQINQISSTCTKEEIEEMKERIRIDYLVKVKNMGHDRGGGFGHSGING